MTFYERSGLFRKYPKTPVFDHSNYRLFERIHAVHGTLNNRGLTVVLEKPKTYQKRRPVTGFKNICLLHGNGPAHASEIVTVFLKKEKVTILPHVLHSLDLAPCDFFMFPKLN